MGSETGDKSNFEPKESYSFGHDHIPEDFKSDLVAANIVPQGFDRKAFQTFLM